MSISLLALVDRTFWLNYILKKELRRYGLRSMFPAKTPFSTRFRGILPPSGPPNHHPIPPTRRRPTVKRGTTYHVDSAGGNDRNPGTSPEQAWAGNRAPRK